MFLYIIKSQQNTWNGIASASFFTPDSCKSQRNRQINQVQQRHVLCGDPHTCLVSQWLAAEHRSTLTSKNLPPHSSITSKPSQTLLLHLSHFSHPHVRFQFPSFPSLQISVQTHRFILFPPLLSAASDQQALIPLTPAVLTQGEMVLCLHLYLHHLAHLKRLNQYQCLHVLCWQVRGPPGYGAAGSSS